MVLWRKMQRDRAASSQQSDEAREIGCESTGLPANAAMVSIGPGLEFRGELTGNSDLRIEGLVEGRINLEGHRLIIGTQSHVTAEVRAKHVIVRGQINGDVIAEDKIEILPTGTVRGNLTAQRIVLSDGSDFHGTVNKVSGKSVDNVCVFPERAEAQPAEPVAETPVAEVPAAPEPSTTESAPRPVETVAPTEEVADTKPKNGVPKKKTAAMWTLIETTREH